MENHFCSEPLWECNEALIRVAQGQEPADIVLRHARVVSTPTHEIFEDADLAISHGRIAYLGLAPHTAEHCIGPNTQVIDAAGRFAMPGLIDSHMHIESSMVGPSQYASAVIPHGTCAIYADPHECANVCGLEGVRAMWEDAARTPLKIMQTTPSCVPAVTGVEDTGASIDAADVAQSMSWPETCGLGEMMNFPGVLAAEKNPLQEIQATLKAGYVVTGHFPSPDCDRQMAAYIASGVSSCHESNTPEDVLTKLRQGIWVQLRYGSAWLNLPGYLPQLISSGVDMRHCMLCTDDCHPHTLIAKGHMDRVLRRAVELGCDPITAVQMCTLNAAEYLGIGHDMGSLTPGKCADVVLVDDLTNFAVSLVLIDGRIVAQDGVLTQQVAPFTWPDFMTHTMNVGPALTLDAFTYPVSQQDLDMRPAELAQKGLCSVRAMGITPGDTLTKNLVVNVPVVNGALMADPTQDLCKVCVFDRHHGEKGLHSKGFVQGFGIHGALAQTVSHDAHNLLVMGDNEKDMLLAAQTLIDCGGGEVCVADGKVLALVKLPVCGLMSDSTIEEVAAQVDAAQEAWRTMGCTMPSPFMTMGIMSLACIPELRLTNRGYVNCLTFQMEDLIVRSPRA